MIETPASVGLARSFLSWAGLGLRRCPACSDPMEAGERLCASCRDRLALVEGPRCRLCGEIVDGGVGVCAVCEAEPPPWDELAYYGPYDGLLRDLILDYKFQRRLGVGRLLMELAAEAAGGVAVVEVTAPVPLHASRLRWRGFNQSRELARLAAVRLGAPIRDRALVRTRATTPQSGLDRARRQANIRGAFLADARLVAGRSVLLADDVLTTGATLSECARALKSAGAARVSVLALARAGAW